MRNKRKNKETNRHIKKYNRIKILGTILYSGCWILYFSYLLYYICFYQILYNSVPLPYTELKYLIIIHILPVVAIIECFYENLCKSRADEIIKVREKRKQWRNEMLSKEGG